MVPRITLTINDYQERLRERFQSSVYVHADIALQRMTPSIAAILENANEHSLPVVAPIKGTKEMCSVSVSNSKVLLFVVVD
jgi:hypothetical protein